MKRFVSKSALFFLITTLLLTTSLIFSNLIIDKNFNYKLDSNIKCLILGHSHTEGAFNDSLISNAKNLARGGEHYFYTYVKARKMIEANPQINTIFLELTNNQVSEDMLCWIKDSEKNVVFIPNYATSMQFDDNKYLIKKDPLGYFESQIYVLQKNLNFIIYNKKSILKQRDWGGFYANPRQRVDSILKVETTQKEKFNKENVDTSSLEFVDKIIDVCKKHKVQIFLIRSPQHNDYDKSNEQELFKIINNKYSNIPYLDFNDFKLSNEEFADLEHLNYKGARKFSIYFNSLITNDTIFLNN